MYDTKDNGCRSADSWPSTQRSYVSPFCRSRQNCPSRAWIENTRCGTEYVSSCKNLSHYIFKISDRTWPNHRFLTLLPSTMKHHWLNWVAVLLYNFYFVHVIIFTNISFFKHPHLHTSHNSALRQTSWWPSANTDRNYYHSRSRTARADNTRRKFCMPQIFVEPDMWADRCIRKIVGFLNCGFSKTSKLY